MDQYSQKENQNPYLLLGFWEFAILSTLMVVFFPWSLLFCLFVYGMEPTKQIVLALIHDGIKTFFALLVGLIGIATLLFFAIVLLGSLYN